MVQANQTICMGILVQPTRKLQMLVRTSKHISFLKVDLDRRVLFKQSP